MFLSQADASYPNLRRAGPPAAGARVEPQQYLASAAVVDIFGG